MKHRILAPQYRRPEKEQPDPNPVEVQCQGKLVYDSFKAAERAMTARPGRGSARPYRCDHCRQWHLGRPSPAAKVKPK